MIDKSPLPEPSDTELIRLTHVTRTYGRVIGVNDLDVALPQGAYALVGPNGAGKTTTISKLAAKYKSEGKKVMLGAGDTFRAAAIEAANNVREQERQAQWKAMSAIAERRLEDK